MGYNIPFQLRDVIPNLYSHWIAKDLFAYMEIAAGSRKRSDFYRIMNRPNRYFSRDAFDTPTVSFDRLKSFYQDRAGKIEQAEGIAKDKTDRVENAL